MTPPRARETWAACPRRANAVLLAVSPNQCHRSGLRLASPRRGAESRSASAAAASSAFVAVSWKADQRDPRSARDRAGLTRRARPNVRRPMRRVVAYKTRALAVRLISASKLRARNDRRTAAWPRATSRRNAGGNLGVAEEPSAAVMPCSLMSQCGYSQSPIARLSLDRRAYTWDRLKVASRERLEQPFCPEVRQCRRSSARPAALARAVVPSGECPFPRELRPRRAGSGTLLSGGSRVALHPASILDPVHRRRWRPRWPDALDPPAQVGVDG